MELQFYKTQQTTVLYSSELTLIKVALLFAEKVNVLSFNFQQIPMAAKIETGSEKHTIMFTKMVHTEQGTLKESLDVELFYKNLLKIRNMKNKQKADLILLARLEAIYKSIHKDMVAYMQEIISKSKLELFKGFVKDESLNIMPHGFDLESEIDPIGLRILNSFLDPLGFHLFDESIMNKAEREDTSEEITFADFTGYTLELDIMEVPNLDSLDYQQLKIIRNEFLSKFESFGKAAEDFQKEISDTLWVEENHEGLKEQLSKRFNTKADDLYTVGEENIYFQQIRNSDADKRVSTLMIGLTSIRTLVFYYWYQRVITIEMRTYIINEIEKHKSADSCSLFFYVESERGREELQHFWDEADKKKELREADEGSKE